MKRRSGHRDEHTEHGAHHGDQELKHCRHSNAVASYDSVVRVTPLVGRKLWFGPRGWGGWGWSPVSWEGWAVCIVGVAFAIVGQRWLSKGVVVAVTSVLILGPCVLKGSSPGGGEKKQREFRAAVRRTDAESKSPPRS